MEHQSISSFENLFFSFSSNFFTFQLDFFLLWPLNLLLSSSYSNLFLSFGCFLCFLCFPIIPQLYHKNEFVIDFRKKAELFNSFFADQCSLISNSSELPSKLEYLTQSRLSSITFSKDDIAKMIQNLDPNKAHGHDQISIRMLKLCSTSICKPLEIIFNQCLETSTFPNDWKKGNVVPIFKKGDKQILKNYRPISLLPMCGKIFEKLIFNEMFKFFIENNLISPNQSGFKPGDSCIN